MGQAPCCACGPDQDASKQAQDLQRRSLFGSEELCLDLSGDYVFLSSDGLSIIDTCHFRIRDGKGHITYGVHSDQNRDVTWDGKVIKSVGHAHPDVVLQEDGDFMSIGSRNCFREASEHWERLQLNRPLSESRRLKERVSLDQEEKEHALESNPYVRTSFDSPLYAALSSGSVRLVRGSFIKDCWETRRPWPMRQEMPESGFWSAAEACRMWRMYGPVFFFALSYAWLHPVLNDPDMWHLERLACILEEVQRCSMARFLWFWKRGIVDKAAPGPPEDVGLFVDYCSLPQRDPNRGIERSPEELQQLITGLGVADIIYGHANTSVIRIASVPPSHQRKYSLRGWPSFELCVSDAKPEYSLKVLHFDDTFRPQENNLQGMELFHSNSSQSHSPPQTPEQFKLDLQRKHSELQQMSPKMPLFGNADDERVVFERYSHVWRQLSQRQVLAYRNVGWCAEEALKLASVIPAFAKLKSLALAGNPIGAEGLLAVFRSLPAELEELTIKNSCAEQAVDDVAPELSRLTHLRYLDLSFQDWGDRGTSLLVSAMPKSVRQLELVKVGMENLGAVSLAERFPQLQALWINYNPLSGKAADVLIDALPTSNLEKIHLGMTQLSEDQKERFRSTWTSMGRNLDCLRL
eukprot:TRINITY_DN15101_c0_g3_i1.p1 TRINITY_DN15101_c0_g3~~TRINITY_DN15101_c0_g3_i1.p1  ORF type:complete len:635 (-),score=87.15 TRINITY_DN15101_c0_g3_i1:18-1922(-)